MYLKKQLICNETVGREEKENKYFCSPLMDDENEVQKEAHHPFSATLATNLCALNCPLEDPTSCHWLYVEIACLTYCLWTLN